MQAINRVVKNTGILYARMAITVGISLYSTRLILTALGAEDFGLFNLVGGAIAMLGFLNGSMAAATQRFISFSQGAGDFEKVKRIFNMSILLHAGVAILAVILLEIAGYFFFHSVFNISPDRVGVGKLIYQFMVASTFVTILSVPYEAVITSHENMLFFAIISILEAVLKLAIAFYITYAIADHLYLYGLLTALLSVLLLIIRRIYCNRKYPECVINVKQHLDKPLLKEMTGFAGWQLLGTSSTMLAFYGQGILLNIFFGTIVNAAQAISNQISGQLGALATALIKAINPAIDKSEGSNNKELMLNLTMTSCKLSFFLMSIFYIPFFIEMPYLLKLWLKEVPEFTVIFCRLLLARNLIEQFGFPLILGVAAKGNIRGIQLSVFFVAFFPLLFAFLFFKMGFQPYTIYLVFLAYSVIIFVITIYYAVKEFELPFAYFMKDILLKSILTLTFFSVILFVTYLNIPQGLLRLAIIITLILIIYLPLIFLLGLNDLEKSKTKKIILSFKKLVFSS
jgi:O-antigen/teichoic acid export membrane protein